MKLLHQKKAKRKLVRKKRHKELDTSSHLRKELEDKEMNAEISKVTLETQNSLFPLWTMEPI